MKLWSSFYQEGNDFQFPSNNVSGSFRTYRSSFIEDRGLITGYDGKKRSVSSSEFRGSIPSDLGDAVITLLVTKANLSRFKDTYQLKKKAGDPDHISTTDFITAIISKALVNIMMKLH